MAGETVARLPFWKIAKLFLKYAAALSEFKRTEEGFRAWLTAFCGAAAEMAAFTPTDLDDEAVALLAANVASEETWPIIWTIASRWVEPAVEPDHIFVQDCDAHGIEPCVVDQLRDLIHLYNAG